MVSPTHAPHTDLETDVTGWLTQNNFMVASETYHDVLPTDMVKTLQNRFTPTSLKVRSTPDKLAVHKSLPVEFYVESKTDGYSNHRNLAVEMLPLIMGRQNALLYGVRTLYVFRHLTCKLEGAFWTDTLPTIEKIIIPTHRWAQPQLDWYAELARRSFPGTEIVFNGKVRGSCDPFVILTESTMRNETTHWQTVITNLMNQNTTVFQMPQAALHRQELANVQYTASVVIAPRSKTGDFLAMLEN